MEVNIVWQVIQWMVDSTSTHRVYYDLGTKPQTLSRCYQIYRNFWTIEVVKQFHMYSNNVNSPKIDKIILQAVRHMKLLLFCSIDEMILRALTVYYESDRLWAIIWRFCNFIWKKNDNIESILELMCINIECMI